MTVFPFPWDATFDAEPADNENINLGAGRIRNISNGVQARMQVDHSWNGDANDGLHVKSEYIPQSASPTLSGTDGAVYAVTTGGNTELFYKDSTGNVIQLTTLGSTPAQNTANAALSTANTANAAAATAQGTANTALSTATNAQGTANYNNLPSGTQMLFYNAPPPGWVLNASVNDTMVRIVNFEGGGGAGTWTISGLSTAGGVTGGYALTTNDIPLTRTATFVVSGGSGFTAAQIDIVGDNAHTHTIFPEAVTGDGSWRPAYLNMVLGIKS